MKIPVELETPLGNFYVIMAVLETAKSHIQTKEPLLLQAGHVSHPNSKSWESLQYMDDALLKGKG